MSIATVVLTVLAIVVVAVLAFVGWQVVRTRRIAAEAERAVPPAGRFIDVDGNRIHYVEKGEGRPILFIHGLGAQLHQFRSPLFPLLDGFRLIAIDRPGSGYSVRAKGASGRLSEQARVVRGVIDRLGLEKPLVVGHSLGGAVSLALAVEHPDAIAGLVLLSPHTRDTHSVPPAFAPLYIRSPLKRWLIAQTVAVPASQRLAAQTLAYVFGPQEPPADYMTAGGGWLGLRPAHVYGSATDIVDLVDDATPLESRYGEISVPVGILFGTADRLIDHRQHGVEMVGKIADLELELAEGVGHMPQFAEPERTAEFIRRIAARAFAPREAA